jgi:hypothetical protein
MHRRCITRLNFVGEAASMEGINREVADPNSGGEQTNFDGKLNDSVKDRVKGVASSVKGKASAIPSMIADGLEAGAEALRQRKTSTSVATTAGSSVTVADDSSIAAVTDTLASGMQSSAEWLRDADIDKLKQGVEKQVKEHPARSLLVALGAGYLIGKALRR